ncbi:phosphatidylserine/phosphatidylglycerophosphate/cardiolipin synthase family protein [uncultured Sphaerochaeta sp.]|uniref:phospholipase D-like domain-containing protein n=1 Tax=uncultured Sphaerochaeta sp. TaxID=886478 RepID=UPI002AA6D376|nr:phosphatidylserine/phosphatidylglycerophosphate/cardiolipin synthase family protein [uncultured Sphaerochaeta sp.]
MMRQVRFVFVIISLIFLATGCSSTQHMISEEVLSDSVPFEEKLSSFQIPSVQVSYPDVYYDGRAWRDRLIELVEGAEDYLITSAFLASSSEELEELYSALARKAESGVRVYFVVDGTGPFDMTETRFHLIPLKFLRESGVHLLEFNSISGARLVSGLNLLYRDHRKFLIVDGKHIALGGMNLNYISIGAEDEQLQRDSMYEFTSPELSSLILDYFVPWWNEQTWDEIDRADFTVDETSLEGKETYQGWYVNQEPKSAQISKLIGSLLSEADHSVQVLPFLPFMDEEMITAFRMAQERGVEIQMIIPFDRRVTNRKGIEYMTKDLLDMGIDLRIEEESAETQRLLHEKLLIVDERYVLIGSTNINYRSMNLAYENSLVIDSPELAQQLKLHFEELYEGTVPITEEMAEGWHTLRNWPRFITAFFGG